MRTLKVVGIVLAVLVLVFIVGGLVMPKGYKVERSERVQAPVEIVFAQVNDLRNWEAWSPWKKMDPTMELTYSDNPVGAGSSYTWAGEASGEGTYRIVKSEANHRIATEIDFGDQGSAEGYWIFQEVDGVTSVTWGFTGHNQGIAGGWFTLMMDGLVGPQFEDGLARIKTIAESTPQVEEPPVEEPPGEAVGTAPPAADVEAGEEASGDEPAAGTGEGDSAPAEGSGTESGQ